MCVDDIAGNMLGPTRGALLLVSSKSPHVPQRPVNSDPGSVSTARDNIASFHQGLVHFRLNISTFL